MMFYAVYPLTPLHKDAVIGGLKRFDHFRRGTPLYDYDCNNEHNNSILLNSAI